MQKRTIKRFYTAGVVMTLIGSIHAADSLLCACIFGVGLLFTVIGYTDMIGHKDNNPYKHL